MVRRSTGDSRPEKAGPSCTIHPSEGGYQPPVTPGGGYRLRLTPKCLRIMIAIGQPSTDSVGAHRENPISLRTTLTLPRYPAVENHRVLRRQDGATYHPSRSQRQPKEAHAVLKNSAHDWRSSGYETICWFCTAPTEAKSWPARVHAILCLLTPPYSPHRPPRKTVRSPYSGVLPP